MARIYATKNLYYYPKVIKIFLVNNKYEADLWFYKTKDIHEADSRDEIWYFSDDEYSATAMICWVEDKYDADVLVYQVRDKYEARWNKGNKFLGRIG